MRPEIAALVAKYAPKKARAVVRQSAPKNATPRKKKPAPGISYAPPANISRRESSPTIEEVPLPPPFKVDVNAVLEAIDAVKHAVAQDLTRPMLCSVYLEGEDTNLLATATDGHVLAHVELPSRFPLAVPLLIHQSYWDDLSSLGATATAKVIKLDQQGDIESFSLSSKEGSVDVEVKFPRFPPWRVIVPSAYDLPVAIEVHPKELIAALRKIPSKDRLRAEMRFLLEDNGSAIVCGVIDDANGTPITHFPYTGQPVVRPTRLGDAPPDKIITFDKKLLTRSLKSMDDEPVTIRLGSDVDPARIELSQHRESRFDIVMPMRTRL